MRYQLLFFAFLILHTSFGQKFQTPTEYVSYIKDQENNISKSTWKYTSAIAQKNWVKIEECKEKLIKDIQVAKKKIGKLKEGYNGDVAYQNQILYYFDLCEKSLTEEYGKIIDLNDLAEQSNDAMDAYMQLDELVNAKLDAENEKVLATYKSFAEKYNVALTEKSEWSQKISVYNQVCAYFNEINLLCFKVNFTDENLSKAILNADLGAIQQNNNILVQYSDEGLSKLETIQPYDGDYSVINSATKVFEYYKKQGQEYIPSVIGFFMSLDKFKNARTTLQSKSKEEKSQEEKDNYTAILKNLENELVAIRKVIYNNEKNKNELLSQWKATGQDFIVRHIPKD